MKIFRREATAGHENTRRDQELKWLKTRQVKAEEKLELVDEIVSLRQKVQHNADRVVKQIVVLNLQAKTIQQELENLEGPKIFSEQQKHRADEQHDIILAEIRKSNEVSQAKNKSEDFPPLRTDKNPQREPGADIQNKRRG